MHDDTHDHGHEAPDHARPAPQRPARSGTERRHATHDKHAGHDPDVFRRQFWIVLALTIPAVAWSQEIQDWVGYSAPLFPGSTYLPAVLGAVIFAYGGRVFLVGARTELASRQPGMMTLISLAITVAFIASVAATLGLFEVELWWELSTLITVMSLGHWIEMRAIRQARGALGALAELLPDTAERIVGDDIEVVGIGELGVGDLVLVRPGARIPADGKVVTGEADVDESMVTGESRPVLKEPGATVVAGTVVAGASLRIKVTAVGEATALSGIMRLVAEAQAASSRAQALADRAAAILFYVALAAGAITLVAWIALGDPEGALVRSATVLVIACPHALGLAIPLVIAISTTLGARNGLLVKSRLALERARELDVVIFDKTGTLTRGQPVLANIVAAGEVDDAELLALAAGVDADSEHPLARALVAGAEKRGVTPSAARDFEALAGRGARASVQGVVVYVGGPRLLSELNAAAPAAIEDKVASWEGLGQTVLYIIRDGAVLGAVGIEDEIRPESFEAVRRLHQLGLRVAMITGDAQAVADSVAERIGIDEVAAQVLPADKADAVRRFQTGGQRVAMVGDGVNDAPALAQADVGIAIGAGTDVAVESAGIILVRDDPRDVVGAIELSRASYRKMIQNLVWATAYNVLAIPLAAGILAPIGIILPMSVGALAMSLSTVIVAVNAQLLRGLRLRPAEAS
ncbi:MAG TPA: heavy metal translocating P-type ATPase [Candidatus Limnocylindria bacterium]